MCVCVYGSFSGGFEKGLFLERIIIVKMSRDGRTDMDGDIGPSKMCRWCVTRPVLNKLQSLAGDNNEMWPFYFWKLCNF